MAMTIRMQLFITLCHLVTGILTFNHTTAKEQCNGHGGLALSRNFIYNNDRNMDVRPTLNEGESAWITGNVIFSKFVSWHGCFDIKDAMNLWKDNLTENNIYNCLELCSSQPDILYIGLQKKVCYCIEWSDLQRLKGKPHTECDMQLIEPHDANNNNDLSSTKTKTNVYTIINDNALHWKPDLHVARSQCVYVEYTGTSAIYVTESCFKLAQGFICVNSASTTLSKTCDSFYPALSDQEPAFCMAHKPSSWLTSFHECLNYSGQLVYNVYPNVKGNMTPYVPYWTGIFRSFKIESEELPMEKNVCLSIKKLDGKLVLDPADCSVDKRYICGSNEPEDTGTVPTTIYIATGVVLTLLFALVLAYLVLRKRINIRERGHISIDDHKTAAIKSDTNTGSTAVSHSGLQSQHQHTEATEKCEYAKPNKALIQHNIPECEYDRAEFSAPVKSTDNTVIAVPVDVNVYSIHSGIKHDDDAGEYDHLHTVGTKQLATPIDVIYNTMSAESDNYNILKSEGKGTSNEQTIKKIQHKDETYPTYDKLI